MSMICGICNRPGIRWVGPFSNLTHTECPHCGGNNCQVDNEPDAQEGPCSECGDLHCNGECFGDDLMGCSG